MVPTKSFIFLLQSKSIYYMMLGRVKNDGTLYSFMTYKEVYDETSDESSGLSVEELEHLLDLANDIEQNPEKYAHACDGKKIATLSMNQVPVLVSVSKLP